MHSRKVHACICSCKQLKVTNGLFTIWVMYVKSKMVISSFGGGVNTESEEWLSVIGKVQVFDV